MRALTMFFCFVAVGFAQPKWDSVKIPSHKSGQRVVDPDHLLSNEDIKGLVGTIKKSALPTIVVFVKDLPGVEEDHKYPAGDVLDTFAKKHNLGEFSNTPSLVVLATARRGNPALRWSISIKGDSDKIKRANDGGYHRFADYVSTHTQGRGSTTGKIMAEAVAEALTKDIWPALK